MNLVQLYNRSSSQVSRQLWPAAVLFLGLVVLYTWPVFVNMTVGEVFVEIPSADLVPASLLPISLLRDGDFYLDEYRSFFDQRWGRRAYFVREVQGHLVSAFQIGAPVLALPVYLVPVGLGHVVSPKMAFILGRISAAVMTAFSSVFLFYAARHLCSPRLAWGLGWVYGLGTSAWSTASQGLWQHTPSLFFQTLALWLLFRARRHPKEMFYVGFFLSCSIVSRYLDLITTLLIMIYVWFSWREHLGKFIIGAAIPVCGMLLYNHFVLGSVFELTYGAGELAGWDVPVWEGMAGLLFSPSRGVLVYSPFFIFLIFVPWHELRNERVYVVCVLAILCMTAVAGRYWIWYGGWGYGYRILTDSLPFWCLLLVPALKRIRPSGLVLFVGLVGFAIAVQAMGLLDYGGRWHQLYDRGGQDTTWLWSLSRSEIVFYARFFSTRAAKYLLQKQ